MVSTSNPVMRSRIRRRNLLVVVLIALSIVAATAAGHDTLARWAVTLLGGRLLDSRVSIDELSSDLRPTCLLVGRATVAGPAGFPDDPMVTIEQARAHYRIGSVVRSPLHITRMEIHIAELRVVKNQEGELNIDRMCSHLESLGDNHLRVDDLTLSLSRVRFEDHSLGPQPLEASVPLGLKSVRFQDVTAPDIGAALAKLATASRHGPQQLFRLRDGWRRLVSPQAGSPSPRETQPEIRP